MKERTKIITACLIIMILFQLTGRLKMIRLQHKSPIEEKFAYFKECSVSSSNCEYRPIMAVWDIYSIDRLKKYYENNGFNDNETLDGGYFSLGEQVDVLEYDIAEGIAFIRIYNNTPRLTKESTVIVSMNCLHDTLPEELRTTISPE
jgi:hypothetical protein